MNDSAHIRSLCNRYLAGRMAAAELEAFLGYLREGADHSLLEEEMMRVLRDEDYPEAMVKRQQEALEGAVLARIGRDRELRSAPVVLLPERKRHRSVWIAAATLATLVAIGAFLWRSDTVKSITLEQPGLAAEAIMPGGNKAVLTLADGTRITLDSLRDGSVVQEGGAQVTKTGKGTIAYRGIPAAPAGSTAYNTLATPIGGQYQLRLPDGTGVWLNAASSIRYPVAFTGNERRVAVTGEVYFEVAEDSRRPFLVTHGNLEVRVLGTHFNLNTYGDEEMLTVTLVEGSIRVTETRSHISTLVKPGEQALLDEGGHLTVDPDAKLGEAIAWKNGLFSFSGTDIHEVMRQLARWYDIDVQYEGGAISKQFYGKIARTADIGDVLKMLQMTEGARFVLKGKQILVMPYEK